MTTVLLSEEQRRDCHRIVRGKCHCRLCDPLELQVVPHHRGLDVVSVRRDSTSRAVPRFLHRWFLSVVVLTSIVAALRAETVAGAIGAVLIVQTVAAVVVTAPVVLRDLTWLALAAAFAGVERRTREFSGPDDIERELIWRGQVAKARRAGR